MTESAFPSLPESAVCGFPHVSASIYPLFPNYSTECVLRGPIPAFSRLANPLRLCRPSGKPQTTYFRCRFLLPTSLVTESLGLAPLRRCARQFDNLMNLLYAEKVRELCLLLPCYHVW